MRVILRLMVDTALAPRAFGWVPLLPAAMLVLFVLSWGDGAGAAAWVDVSFYEQVRWLEAGALLWVLPWITARALPRVDAADEVRLSALTGAPPSRLLLARVLAAAVPGALAVLGAAPVAIIAQRMSGGPLARVVLHDAALLAVVALSVAMAAWTSRIATSPVAQWGAGVAVLAGLAAIVTVAALPPQAVAAACVLVAAAGTLGVMRAADHEAHGAPGAGQ